MYKYITDNDGNKISIGKYNNNTREVSFIDTNFSLEYIVITSPNPNESPVYSYNYFKSGYTRTTVRQFDHTQDGIVNSANAWVYKNGQGPGYHLNEIGLSYGWKRAKRIIGFYFCENEINEKEFRIAMVYEAENGEIIQTITGSTGYYGTPFNPTNVFGANWEDEVEVVEAYPEESEEDGGYGDKDLTSDTIDLPDLPSVTGLTSNFITAYAPSNAQLNQLANFMWTSDFLDNFKKLWSNPMENLISLAIMPFNVNTSGTGTVVIGYWLTDVTMPKITQQFQEIDCGSLKIGKFYNSFLDYSPYTKINIYLPFIGIRQLKVDEIMDKTLSVKYRVDIISGTCVAYILVNNSIFYQFNGNCATTIPITNADYSNLINASLQSTSGVITMGAGIMGGASIVAGAGASMLAGGMIDTVTSMKPDINKSGNMSGSSGMMGVKTPFLMKEIPRQSWAKDNNKFKGIPSNVLSKLSALKGYTEVDKINLSDIKATEKEMIEIENLLKQGVIL